METRQVMLFWFCVLMFFSLASAQDTLIIRPQQPQPTTIISQAPEVKNWAGFRLVSRNFRAVGLGGHMGFVDAFAPGVHGRINASYAFVGGQLELGADVQTSFSRGVSRDIPGLRYDIYTGGGMRVLVSNVGAAGIGLGGILGVEWRRYNMGGFIEMDASALPFIIETTNAANQGSLENFAFGLSVGMNFYF